MTTNDQNELDFYLPNKKVCSILGVGPRTIHRYENDPALHFPTPIWIRKRKYQLASEIRRWQEGRGGAHIAARQLLKSEG